MVDDLNGSNQCKSQMHDWQAELTDRSLREVIEWSCQKFNGHLAFASSLGAEDQVITHVLAETAPKVRIFTLDTGRLFPEAFELIERTERRYKIKIEVYSPSSEEVESMVREHGIDLFYQSVELRKLCCGVRKLQPLKRALQGVDAWICGLRRDQAVTRQDLKVIEWDFQNDLPKISPLWNWTEKELWDYIKAHYVPYNPLHDKGFLSIGCSCCTRAVLPGEDIRAGRWWWENPEHKECGLHSRGDQFARDPFSFTGSTIKPSQS